MGSINASRLGLAQNVTDALQNAELVGWNDRGNVCVWSGGYTFNVYDAARDWNESYSFTSGDLVDTQKEELARNVMETRGFKII